MAVVALLRKMFSRYWSSADIDWSLRAVLKITHTTHVLVSYLQYSGGCYEKNESTLNRCRASAPVSCAASVVLFLLFFKRFFPGFFFRQAYCVYEVYSWDVMEPATYFLMVSV